MCLLVGWVVGLSACADEMPGLALTLEIDPTALSRVERLRFLVESKDPALPLLAPMTVFEQTTADGVDVRSEGSRVVIELDRSSFQLAETFELLLQATSSIGSIPLRLTGAVYQSDGLLLARARTEPEVPSLSASERTEAKLIFTCALAACAPQAANGLSVDEAPVPVATIRGLQSADRLLPLATGKLLAGSAGDALVLGAPTRSELGRSAAGVVYVLPAQDFSRAGVPTAIDLGAALKIVGRENDGVGAAAAVGDFNGDGIADLVVTGLAAARPMLTATSGAGVAYVISGARLEPGATIDLASADSYLVRVLGEKGQERLGTAVALAHISSLRFADLVLGAPGADGVAAVPNGGRAYLVAGREVPLSGADLQMDAPGSGAQSATLLGGIGNTQLGAQLTAADLDGDNRAEIVVGNYLEQGKGVVHVLAGARLATGGVFDLSADSYDSRVIGRLGSQLGLAVGVIDIGLARPLLVLGAPGESSTYLVDVTELLGTPNATRDLGMGEYYAAISGTPGSRFGAALATGRLDADDRADLIVGAPAASGLSGAAAAGAAFVLLGEDLRGAGSRSTISALQSTAAIYGAAAGDALGSRVLASDWDSSSVTEEIVLGAALQSDEAKGGVYVFSKLP